MVLAGAPGTGKTILAQQICFACATPERKAIYCTTLSEPHSKLVRHLEPFELLRRRMRSGAASSSCTSATSCCRRTATGWTRLVSEVVDKCFEANPAVVVIDSAKALRLFADDQSLRVAYYELASRLAHTGAVADSRG